ncbi:NAD(P)H-dependent oxidoreductase subunit E [Patescibacteria group bacterium]|nr:NAD(P)H-dependent oxidoreductase subunit E [Patescibacteria group bacterium]MBU1721811.1 NAD(P)H-dependent oxidoreductase subunit E [Patescibacteria group bacterium]MBU1901695.1 NAD(P)H-dependent oxidoreductase subunit E [Patescibacteria group bacterium]
MSKKIRVCRGRVCLSFGATRLMDALSKATELKPGESNKTYDLDYCGCLGYCGYAPSVEVDDTHIVCECTTDNVVYKVNNAEKEDCLGEGEHIDVKDEFLGDI